MYHFIVNPNARTGRGKELWKIVETELNARGVEYEVFFTKGPHHATEIVRGLTFDEIKRTIVVIGGDGTMNEVVNGLVNLKGVTLGYIPAGSSNDLARSLRISSDPLSALELVLNPKFFYDMDLGVLEFDGKSRRFAVSAGVGYDAAVCHQALNSEFKKKMNKIKLGKLTYFGIALKQLFTKKPFAATLVLDDSRTYKFERVVFMAAHNQRFEGGGFMFCPSAVSNDGKLDVIIADNLPPLRIASLLPGAFKGGHVGKAGIHIYRASKIELICQDKEPVHLDGESGGIRDHVVARILDERVRIITPGA